MYFGSPFPLGDSLGLTWQDDVDPGRAVVDFTVGPSHLNPHGIVHGGVLFTVADTAMGAAAMSLLGPEERCVSIEVHIRFLLPSLGGRLQVEATVAHRGRRIVQLEARVRDGDRLIAIASGSFAVVPKQ